MGSKKAGGATAGLFAARRIYAKANIKSPAYPMIRAGLLNFNIVYQ